MPPAPPPFSIRTATPADLPTLLALDPLAPTDAARTRLITEATTTGTCFVATPRPNSPQSTPGTPPLAFAIYQHRFFGHAFIELLVTHPDHRRQGLATALISHIEHHACQTPKLFTSANRSNIPMRTLLANLDFTQTGTITDLDESDPELIYVKRIKPNQQPRTPP